MSSLMFCFNQCRRNLHVYRYVYMNICIIYTRAETEIFSLLNYVLICPFLFD